jgi:hypothetical protein
MPLARVVLALQPITHSILSREFMLTRARQFAIILREAARAQ